MRKKAHIAIREGEKIRNVYVMPEEKEEIKNMKEQGLRSLRQAYILRISDQLLLVHNTSSAMTSPLHAFI
jgi:hypothetical protein